MTEKEFFDRLKRIGPEYERLISRTLPVKIGVKAKSRLLQRMAARQHPPRRSRHQGDEQ